MADERKLSAEQLCRRCDPEVLAFETTDDLEMDDLETDDLETYDLEADLELASN